MKPEYNPARQRQSCHLLYGVYEILDYLNSSFAALFRHAVLNPSSRLLVREQRPASRNDSPQTELYRSSKERGEGLFIP
jgi:hypothetical protein